MGGTGSELCLLVGFGAYGTEPLVLTVLNL